MARRKKVQMHNNRDRWLVSYADFITLLFAFFVVMYSISSVNDGKYRVLSDSLEATFTPPKKSLDPIQFGEISRGQGQKTAEHLSVNRPETLIELQEIEIEVFTPPPVSEETIQTINNISRKLNSSLYDMIENEDVILKQGEDWIELEMKSNVLFFSGEARLAKMAVPIIGKVANILRNSSNLIQVEGFTDNNPIHTARFPSNWELSAARAASVVHLLDRYGVNPARMSAIGFGEFKPVADNSTEEGKQKNRRVVLVILGSDKTNRSIETFTSPIEESITTSPPELDLPDVSPIAPTVTTGPRAVSTLPEQDEEPVPNENPEETTP